MIMTVNHYRAASIAKLREVKLDCSPSKVRAIWAARSYHELEKAWPAVVDQQGYGTHRLSFQESKRRAVNHAGGFCGVELAGVHKDTCREVYYCNAGDTYAPTIYFHGAVLHVGTLGDLAEGGQIRGPQADY